MTGYLATQRRMRCYGRRGFTLVELLVVIAIISVLAGLLLPALATVRETARTAYCMNNLKQFGIGGAFYSDAYGSWVLPACIGYDDSTNSYDSYWFQSTGSMALIDAFKQCMGLDNMISVSGWPRGLSCANATLVPETGSSFSFSRVYAVNCEAKGWGAKPGMGAWRHSQIHAPSHKIHLADAPAWQILKAQSEYSLFYGQYGEECGPGHGQMIGYRHGNKDTTNILFHDSHVASKQYGEVENNTPLWDPRQP